ncbi:MAG: hypothetical protein IPJ65_00170 [Archangiaceae bacterium]|nr:hypothetical protein [Archangiaceae bacterium]
MVRRAPVVLVVLWACFPPSLDESGRRCDEAQGRGCGSGYVCFDGLCSRPEDIDAGPDNWLTNGGFEKVNDAGSMPLLWRNLPVGQGGEIASDTTFVREGVRSVRLFSRDGGEQPGVMQTTAGEIRDTRFGQVWCARAWVRSTSTDGGLGAQLFLRERPDDGGVAVAENTPNRVRVSTEWTLLEERYVAEGAERLDVRVVNLGRVKKGELLWVDDVRLKRSASSSCTW